MSEKQNRRPVVLCILDGWGHSDVEKDNAIRLAKTPTWDRLMRGSPHSLIDASETFVGLPSGQMGNSEVGHMNLGAGRVVLQDLPRIDKAIASGALAANPRLHAFIDRLKQSGGTCHLMGLMSPGGVHSMQTHIVALARIVAEAGVPIAVHAFLDGRDTPPSSARGYMEEFLAVTRDLPGLAVATVDGRYYAMDRDKRWDRTQLAYDAIVDGRGEEAADPLSAIDAGYARGETDEFVRPTVIGEYRGMADGDGVLMANFRADRVRQLLGALLDPDFDGFARSRPLKLAAAAGMTEYSTTLNPYLLTLFPPESLRHVMGAVLAEAGLTQLRIAETEKYAHVTFFFNGGEETLFPGEERILVPSPKVATYDLKPEMSAFEVTDRLVEAIDSGRFDFVVVNYANTDMVGHSGNLDAAIKAVEAVDRCLGRLVEAVTRAGGTMLITADHGNAETMRNPDTGEVQTAHTLNRVPAVLVNPPAGISTLADGALADVAPTLLELLGLPKPREMTGQSLIAEAAESGDRDAARERRASV
ncbi:2,3-bisphosphoglycerate-independent phosphoglycerate mutase [Rhodospirillaceae bacterium SYSU D60014]|uniref:2,3-bisphosphoglycerate-independent phosphoglycerate mutase n=1 Tax=Virgifigura deserti TaxID=2268457 RepID=UPI000E6633A1